MLDYYIGEDENLYAPVPWKHQDPAFVKHSVMGNQDSEPGDWTSFSWPFKHGDCIFLKDGLCSIHPVKPLICRLGHHDDSLDIPLESGDMNRIIARAWQESGTELHRIKRHKEQRRQESLQEV